MLNGLVEGNSDLNTVNEIAKSENPETLEKALDRSKLVPKKITDKNGYSRTVWVKAGSDQKKSETQPKQEEEKPKAKSSSASDLKKLKGTMMKYLTNNYDGDIVADFVDDQHVKYNGKDIHGFSIGVHLAEDKNDTNQTNMFAKVDGKWKVLDMSSSSFDDGEDISDDYEDDDWIDVDSMEEAIDRACESWS